MMADECTFPPTGSAGRDGSGPVIRFDGVGKKYGKRRVLEDFSLDVHQGELLTVIGTSGCGKTTMLKMINGLHSPDSGSIYLWGQDLAGMDIIRLRRRIGYVIQGTGLFPHMDVWNNIAYVPVILNKAGKKQTADTVERLMDLMDLDPALARRYPAELSGGQQQRVGIARALAASPELMLMDEPFSAVDEITREMLQDELLRIHRKLRLTILLVTHDIRESCKLGTRILVMSEGKKVQTGTREELRSNPADPLVSRLIESLDNPVITRC